MDESMDRPINGATMGLCHGRPSRRAVVRGLAAWLSVAAARGSAQEAASADVRASLGRRRTHRPGILSQHPSDRA
jgi:hypothetical protein